MPSIDQTRELNRYSFFFNSSVDDKIIPRKTGGVYWIRCLRNGKMYVGKTNDLRVRLQTHRYLLRSNKETNKHLQCSYNAHGAENFVFEPLELVSYENDRVVVESRWLELLHDNHRSCFNHIRTSFTTTHKNHMNSYKKKRILRNPSGEVVVVDGIRNFCDKNNLSSSAISSLINEKIISYKGWTNPSRTEKRIASLRHRNKRHMAKTYELVDPAGKSVTIKNLHEFCNKSGLNRSMLHNLINGRIEQYKGWTRPGEDRNKIFKQLNERIERRYEARRLKAIFVHDEKGKVHVSNIRKFCEDNDLDHATICKVISGERKQHKGWRVLPFQA